MPWFGTGWYLCIWKSNSTNCEVLLLFHLFSSPPQSETTELIRIRALIGWKCNDTPTTQFLKGLLEMIFLEHPVFLKHDWLNLLWWLKRYHRASPYKTFCQEDRSPWGRNDAEVLTGEHTATFFVLTLEYHCVCKCLSISILCISVVLLSLWLEFGPFLFLTPTSTYLLPTY